MAWEDTLQAQTIQCRKLLITTCKIGLLGYGRVGAGADMLFSAGPANYCRQALLGADSQRRRACWAYIAPPPRPAAEFSSKVELVAATYAPPVAARAPPDSLLAQPTNTDSCTSTLAFLFIAATAPPIPAAVHLKARAV